MVDGCVLGAYIEDTDSLEELEQTYDLFRRKCADIKNQRPAYEAKKKELEELENSGKS